MTKREWVVGFLYDFDAERVVLIRKKRPEWQAGKLNGVGGKIEPGETPDDAMRREFYEETGQMVLSWQRFASLRWEGEQGVVHFFRSFAYRSILDACRSVTDEEVWTMAPHDVALWPSNYIPNLRWLIPLGAHRHDAYDVIDVVETGTTMRKPGRLEVHGV
jgi:8-oxo-dGTP diphosphatase